MKMEALAIIFSLSFALGVSAFFIILQGSDPLIGYVGLFRGAFGSAHNFLETLVKMGPLLFVGLGAAVSYKCSFWSIGFEGQLLAGAMAATWVGITFTGTTSLLVLPLVIVMSFLMGMLWAAIPALLKVRFQISEVITSLMMNYIILYFIQYLVLGPWTDPSFVMAASRLIDPSARILRLLSGTRLHGGFLIAVACIPLVYILLQKTSLGYEIKCVGANITASRYAGIPVRKIMIIAAAIGGGLAGLAGMGEVIGLHYRLRADISPGYGYTGILIALLGRSHPLGIALVSFLFAGLLNGSIVMQRVAEIPTALIPVIQSIIVLSVLAGEVLTLYRITIRRTK